MNWANSLVKNVQVSLLQIPEKIKFFNQKIGDHWFEKGSVAEMERYAKSLGSYHSKQVAQFEDSSCNICNRTCACNKLLLTLSVLDEDYYKTLQASDIKPGSKIFVLAMCDDLDLKASHHLLLC